MNNNHENFVDKSEQLNKTGAEDATSNSHGKGYQTFDNEPFHFENNTIEFIYCIEKKSEMENTATNKLTAGDKSTQSGTPFWSTVPLLLVLTCGTPMLIVPKVFISTGYVTGSVVLLFIVCFYVYCLRMMLRSAQEIRKRRREPIAFTDLLYETLMLEPALAGYRLASFIRLLSLCIFVVTWFSVCLLLYLLAAQNIQTFYSEWFQSDITQRETLIMILVPALALCLLGDIQLMKSFAVFGFACHLVNLILVAGYALTDSAEWQFQEEKRKFQIPSYYVSLLLVHLSIVPAILQIKGDTKTAQKSNQTLETLPLGYVVIFIIHLSFCLICGLRYGVGGVPDNSILIIPTEQPLDQVNLIFYGIGIACTYPYLYCIVIDSIHNEIFKMPYKQTCCQVFWGYGLRVVLVLLSFLLTYLHPSRVLFVSFGGTVCTSIDSIIYPAVVQTLVEWKLGKNWLKFAYTVIRNSIILGVGLYLVAIGVNDCLGVI